MTVNEINRHIVEAAIEVQSALGGPGLLESVYEEALVWELQLRGLQVQKASIVANTVQGPHPRFILANRFDRRRERNH